MPELLSPFAPIHEWLREHLRLWIVRFIKADNFSTTTHRSRVLDVEDAEDWSLDCRDPATRFAILSALADHSILRPWALGGIWSSLTDEQAGRVTAEVVRALGADPANPSSIIPFGILSEWLTPADLAEDSKPPRSHRYGVALEWRVLVLGNDDGGRYSGVFRAGWIADFRPPEGVRYMGDERGDEGKTAADEAAIASGALLWEQITPPEKADV